MVSYFILIRRPADPEVGSQAGRVMYKKRGLRSADDYGLVMMNDHNSYFLVSQIYGLAHNVLLVTRIWNVEAVINV